MKNSTANKYRFALSPVFDMAVDMGIRDTNPCKGIKKFPEDPVVKEPLADLQVEHLTDFLLDYPNKVQSMSLLVSLHTSMRIRNVIGLEWGMVDFETMAITLPKTKNGDAHKLPMSGLTAAVLRKCEEFRENQYVFPSTVKKGSHISYPRACHEKAKVYVAEKTGVSSTWTIHDLRRTNGTRLLEATGDIRAVQQVLGHKQITTTQLYAKHSIESIRRAVDLTAARLAPDQQSIIDRIKEI